MNGNTVEYLNFIYNCNTKKGYKNFIITVSSFLVPVPDPVVSEPF